MQKAIRWLNHLFFHSLEGPPERRGLFFFVSMLGNKGGLSYIRDMKETKTHPRFTDLLKDEHFLAIFKEWEYLESINDDGSVVLWDYMVEKFNYEA